DKLAISGSVTIQSGANVNFTQITSPSVGKYVLLTSTQGAITNNFTATGIPSGYWLTTPTATELDLQHRATIQVSAATPASATITTGGSTAFTFTVSNTAIAGSSDLAASA